MAEQLSAQKTVWLQAPPPGSEPKASGHEPGWLPPGVRRAQSSSGGSGRRWHWRQCWPSAFFQGLGPLLRSHPRAWIVPLLLMLVVAAGGVVGVMMASRDQVAQAVRAAQGFAESAAVSIDTQMESTGAAPLLAMAAFVQEDPQYSNLGKWFEPVARKLLAAIGGQKAILQVGPQGVLSHVYPLKGNERAVGLDLLNSSDDRQAALATIQRGEMTMQGPFKVVQGFDAVIFRLPIFIPNVSANETFGAPHQVHNCSVCDGPLEAQPASCDVCYNTKMRSKFWGFVAVVVNVDELKAGTDGRLKKLTDLGYNYALYAPQPDGSTTLVVQTPSAPVDAVVTTVQLPTSDPDTYWRLYVAPASGWVPWWRTPMIVVVTLLSLALGLLAFGIWVNRLRLVAALAELQKTNKALADEKERMDVLLARQYDLICCALGQQQQQKDEIRRARAAAAAAERSMPTTTCNSQLAPTEEALERIESMRASIAANRSGNGPQGADEVLLLELLGEGGFGKVYRGVWRGSEVAVKVMLLPTRMTGQEKRERMALMEAAISSAMNHPNILQTFTYTIKNVTNSYAAAVLQPGPPNKCAAKSIGRSFTPSDSEGTMVLDTNSLTHNFEVSLVLEFCDQGTLRDALNARAFLLDDGSLNYAAILDTAADVARAMLHLHRQQIIHSDLKARNVLLKTDGRSGRGAVAKVGDFGLAVRIDAQATHVSEYRGTMSHMAPETQLHRRVTKASDVYAYGITLWELYTGMRAYGHIPHTLVGHAVTVDGTRPAFPPDTPPGYRALAENCWVPNPDMRPTFTVILEAVLRLREELGGVTPPLRRYTPPRPGDRRNALQEGSDEGAAQHSGGPGGGPIDFGMQRDVEAGSSWDQDGVSKHWQAPL